MFNPAMDFASYFVEGSAIFTRCLVIESLFTEAWNSGSSYHFLFGFRTFFGKSFHSEKLQLWI